MKDKSHILVVEDSCIVRERLIQRLLQLEDVEVSESGDVRSARALVRDQCPEVVVLDLELPDGNGLNLIAAIKQHCPHTMVAILTNHTTPRIREQGIARGADFFFDKSTDIDSMVAAIVQWREKHDK